MLDVVGPAVESPTLASTLTLPGGVNLRWHVGASWFSGTTMPAAFATAEVIPAQPVRMFATTDPGQKAAAIRAAFEARKLVKSDDPRLIAAATSAKFLDQ